jgi:hypothetical protein
MQRKLQKALVSIIARCRDDYQIISGSNQPYGD